MLLRNPRTVKAPSAAERFRLIRADPVDFHVEPLDLQRHGATNDSFAERVVEDRLPGPRSEGECRGCRV